MAKKGAFGVLEVGATPNVIGEVRSWRQPNESNEIDVTVMGTGNASMIPGATRESMECDLFWEYADAGQAYILANLGADSSHLVTLYPEGKGTGLPAWSGNCYIMSANPEAAADGAIEMNGCTFVTDSAGGSWSTQA